MTFAGLVQKEKRDATVIRVLSLVCLIAAFHAGAAEKEGSIPYRYAGKEEGAKLLLENTAYHDGMSACELMYKMQDRDAHLDAYKKDAAEQVLEFTQKDREALDRNMAALEKRIADQGLVLPPLDEIVFIKTTMKEEGDAAGYTHGTQIYLGSRPLKMTAAGSLDEELQNILAHELFHCLTRCNPDFRSEMYSLIHFTVQSEDFPLPPSVYERYISNPDVEHHNAYAAFSIGGETIDCFTALIVTKPFENPGDRFFDVMTTALVPIDGRDCYYLPEEASNFDEIFGRNTDYVIDPEECMADNFAFALVNGLDGPSGRGYPNPEIIEGILQFLSSGKAEPDESAGAA